MNQVVVVRSATADDALNLKSIRLLSLRDEPDAYGSTYEESVQFSDHHWMQMSTQWNYFLAFRGDEVIGIVSGGQFPPFPDAKWLYGMFVRVDQRGTGVANQLVRAVAGWTRDQGVSTLGLHVTTTVARAVAFYTKIGFVATGVVEPMPRNRSLLLQTMTTDLRTNDFI